MNKESEIVILENNDLLSLSDSELQFLSPESLEEVYKLRRRLEHLSKESE